MKIKILLGILALSIQAHAGGMSDVGGGGRAIVCFDHSKVVERLKQSCATQKQIDPKYTGCGVVPDSELSHITSIETLDLFEAKQPRLNNESVEIYPVKQGQVGFDYARGLADIIEPYAPQLSSQIYYGAWAFDESKISLTKTPLINKDDAAELISLNHDQCVLTTAAIQYSTDGLNFLQIDGRLFHHPKQSELSRAVLFLHEALYQRVRRFQNNSRNTRDMVGLLIRRYQAIELIDFLHEIQSLGFLTKTSTDSYTDRPPYQHIINPVHQMHNEIKNSVVNFIDKDNQAFYETETIQETFKELKEFLNSAIKFSAEQTIQKDNFDPSSFAGYHRTGRELAPYISFDKDELGKFLLFYEALLNHSPKQRYFEIKSIENYIHCDDTGKRTCSFAKVIINFPIECNKFSGGLDSIVIGTLFWNQTSVQEVWEKKLPELVGFASQDQWQNKLDQFIALLQSKLLFKKQVYENLKAINKAHKSNLNSLAFAQLQTKLDKNLNNFENLYTSKLKQRFTDQITEHIGQYLQSTCSQYNPEFQSANDTFTASADPRFSEYLYTRISW